MAHGAAAGARWVPARWVNQSPVEDQARWFLAILRSSTSARAAASMAARWERSFSQAATVSTSSSGDFAAHRTSSTERGAVGGSGHLGGAAGRERGAFHDPTPPATTDTRARKRQRNVKYSSNCSNNFRRRWLRSERQRASRNPVTEAAAPGLEAQALRAFAPRPAAGPHRTVVEERAPASVSKPRDARRLVSPGLEAQALRAFAPRPAGAHAG